MFLLQKDIDTLVYFEDIFLCDPELKRISVNTKHYINLLSMLYLMTKDYNSISELIELEKLNPRIEFTIESVAYIKTLVKYMRCFQKNHEKQVISAYGKRLNLEY